MMFFWQAVDVPFRFAAFLYTVGFRSLLKFQKPVEQQKTAKQDFKKYGFDTS